MQKIILLLLCAELTSHLSNAQNFQKYYDRDFGTTNSIGEVGHAIIQTGDGGYMAVGYSENYGIGLKDIFAVRLNSNGDTVWTKLYGNAGGNDMARSVVQTSDGGFAIAAETQTGAGGTDAAILKIDSGGALLWSKSFGGTKDDIGHSIIEMNDESLFLLGETQSFDVNEYADMFLVHTDKNGNFIGSKTLGAGYDQSARSIVKTSDGGFVISGDVYCGFCTDPVYGFYIAKFNANGDTLWSKAYNNGSTTYEGYAANPTTDGGYIMTGYTYGGSIGGTDIIALKVTATGEISWTKAIGTINYDYATDIIQTADGGYVFSGTASPGGSFNDLLMAKLNANGVLQWSRNYSGDYGTTYATDARFQVIQTNDNGLATIASIYNNFGNSIAQLYNGFDVLIVKTNSDGEGISAGCVKDAGIQVQNITWSAYSAPLVVASVSPTVTNTPFIQKFTGGNYGNVAVKINFVTTPVSCGSCDGSATASTCDSSGWYCSGKNPYTYLWNDVMSQTDMTATALCSGNYTVTITDYNGCKGIATTSITSAAQPVEICLVTVDSTSTKNLIVWEKPVSTGIDSFRIYREIGLNNYVPLGNVAYEDFSKFIDQTQGVNPNTTSYRYKISVLDTCGNESAKSASHKTIHLQVSPASPQGINLNWTDYLGYSFSQYRVLRDIDNTGNWQVMDSVSFSTTSYTDTAGTQNSRYIIEAAHPTGCVVTKSTENHNTSRSNKSIPLAPPGGIIDLGNDDLMFHILPNPNHGKFDIQIVNDYKFTDYELIIYNVLGENIYSMQRSIKNEPIAVKLPSGIYYVQIITTSPEQLKIRHAKMVVAE